MNDWIFTYQGFEPEKEGLREALCTLGNGYFATRGAAPESVADGVHYPGTYFAGGFNRLVTPVADRMIENEDLVNWPNWLPLTFRIEGGDWFDAGQVELLDYRQELDLEGGELLRTVHYRDKEGRETKVRQRRIVHMLQPHLAAQLFEIEPVNWSGKLEVRTALDGKVVNGGVARYQKLNNKHLEPLEEDQFAPDSIYLKVQTNQSEIRVAEAARTRVYRGDELLEPERRLEKEPGFIAQNFILDATAGVTIKVEKIVAIFSSLDQAISECGLEACRLSARPSRYADLARSQRLVWKQLWRRFDIDVELTDTGSSGDMMRVVRLYILQLLQTVSPNTRNLDAGVPARGLHGEAYRGHIFWDELFIFPVLNFRIPEVTRSLLHYRYRRLGEARYGAREAGYEGAMFPWQSGSDGREESQLVHLNPESGRWIPDSSNLQRHVNLAIAFNVWQYFQATEDIEFLSYYGAEMLLEITRFFGSICTYNEELDRYEIHKVMGPDEYHEAYPDSEEPGLSNNAYTNLMVVWIMIRVGEVLAILPENRRRDLVEILNLRDEEIAKWDDISRKMRIVFHGNGIISQFEGYDQLLEFDWEGYRKKYGDIQRLDRILEAEHDSPNRYKLSKQADVLMLFYLLSTEELRSIFERLGYPLESDTIQKNIEYYRQRTSHGSTLSRVVHSWVMARSDREASWEHFLSALQSDVADVQGGSTPEGIHTGAMAGTVDLIQRAYLGIELRDNMLWLNPRLPKEIKALRLKIVYRGFALILLADKEKLVVEAEHSNTRSIK
ncbi:MAG: glycosyl hydrolase family 65 protein, partial [bacterium]